MKPIAPKTLPAEIVVARGILKKAGSLLVSPGGGARRILWLCDLPDTDPAPSTLLPSLAKAGHAVVRAPSGTPFPADIDAILAVGDAKSLGDAARLIEDRRPDLPCALVPTTPEAQLAFPFLSSPELVLVDPSLPVTDAAEKRGVVELIRYAVGFDASLFDLLYTDFDPGALIRRCLTIRCDLIDAEKTDLLARLGTVIGRAVGAALSSRDGSAAADGFAPCGSGSNGLRRGEALLASRSFAILPALPNTVPKTPMTIHMTSMTSTDEEPTDAATSVHSA